MSKQQKLTGKVAIVTGASKGIGAGIAKELAAQGASVVVNYASSKDDADRVVSEIVNAGGKAAAVRANVADQSDIDGLFAATKKAYGKLDLLVNNAGIYAFAPLGSITGESIESMFSTNVTGLLFASQAALAAFPAEGGSIVNIGSVVGELTPPTSAVYSGTKGAVNSITRVLAKELGSKNIRVNAVNPGAVKTEGFKSAGLEGDFEAQMVAATPLGRAGQPGDIATIVAFLASDDAGWITGSLIDAAGGSR
ncbi:SDR family NAD(P)-dependent oxidoreductase [Burkholderia sp. L27(2015)]|uniref:SDR family NAD(P)-dependent oxidoreductase n=1 Tax=Burkholderia sp. L27(2015) TaxID=1641858 RepID=UPI00131C9AB4|nr:glucose 1-dehydrogenase [Burkholderia sp. L27(2015)]